MQTHIHAFLSENDREWCEKHNVQMVWPGHENYPTQFELLTCRPGLLFYMGEPIWRNLPLISVVGSRAPQPSSLLWLDKELGEFLRHHTVGVVSGGARGIDQKAHQVAIRNKRPTCAFLPSGLREMYPAQFHDWVAPILATGGCLISQFLPSMRMQKSYFHQRNLLIAAMSEVTLVVECKRRSGTLLTANYALEYDKRLAVMPTFAGEAGLGGLDLICDSGATPVRDWRDIEIMLGASLFKFL